MFEDGAPQSVQTFELITFTSSPFDSERRDPTTLSDSERQAADPRNRLFVVYLDRFHTTRAGSRDSRQSLVDFLNRTIGASDLFAVMTPETPPGGLTFARRTDTIEQELSKHWDWGERDQLLTPRTPAEEHLVSCAMEVYQGNSQRWTLFTDATANNSTHNSLDALILPASRYSRRTDEPASWSRKAGRPKASARTSQSFRPGRPPIPTIGVSRGGQSRAETLRPATLMGRVPHGHRRISRR